jgi:hypothetical protein
MSIIHAPFNRISSFSNIHQYVFFNNGVSPLKFKSILFVQFDKNLNDDNPINDHDNVLDVSNVDVGIDDHFFSPLDIYDPRIWGHS